MIKNVTYWFKFGFLSSKLDEWARFIFSDNDEQSTSLRIAANSPTVLPYLHSTQKFIERPSLVVHTSEQTSYQTKLPRLFTHLNILPVIGMCSHPPNIAVISEYIPLGSLHNVLHPKEG